MKKTTPNGQHRPTDFERTSPSLGAVDSPQFDRTSEPRNQSQHQQATHVASKLLEAKTLSQEGEMVGELRRTLQESNGKNRKVLLGRWGSPRKMKIGDLAHWMATLMGLDGTTSPLLERDTAFQDLPMF